MRILVREGQSVLSDLLFDEIPIQVGSEPGCAVHLPDMRVGAHHALLKPLEHGQWIIEHQAGGAQTLVNGHLLRDAVQLSHGDQISIQDYTLNIYLEHRARAGEEADIDEQADLAKKYPVPRGTVTKAGRHDVTLSPDQLVGVAGLASELGACIDASSLMEVVLDGLGKRIPHRAVWIGLRRHGHGPLDHIQGRDLHGQLFESPKLNESLMYRCLDRGISVFVPRMKEDAETSSLLAAPLVTKSGRLGFVYLDSGKKQQPFELQHLEYLIALSTVIGERLHLVMQGQARARKAVSTAEGSIVHAIQAKLDPKAVPIWPDLQVAVHCQGGTENAGDVYDVMQLPNGAAAFLFGHVEAPPATAAISMIQVRTAFRIAVLHTDLPHVMMRQFNWLLLEQGEKATMQCTVVLADPKTGALLHCIAGDICALVIGQSGRPRTLGDQPVQKLGIQPNFGYTTRKGLLGKQETMALYTPGLLELRDASGKVLEASRFTESLCDGFGTSARAALDGTLADLSPYLTSGNQSSDFAILLAHREG